jgi:hypothetical protein
MLKKLVHYISEVCYVIRSSYVMFYVGEVATSRSILQNIWDNDISCLGGNDLLRVLLLDRAFSLGEVDR